MSEQSINPAVMRQLETASARNSAVYHALLKARCGELSLVDALAWGVIQLEADNRSMAKKMKAKVPVAKPVYSRVPVTKLDAKPIRSMIPVLVAKPVRSESTFGDSECVLDSIVRRPRRRHEEPPTTKNIRPPKRDRQSKK